MDTTTIQEELDKLTGLETLVVLTPDKGGFWLVVGNRDSANIWVLTRDELAAAMSFEPDYEFTGNRSQKVKQIGNAVPRKTAKALCLSLLGN